MSRRLALLLIFVAGCSGGGGGGTGGGSGTAGSSSAGGGSANAGGSATAGGSGTAGGAATGTDCPVMQSSDPKHHQYGRATATPIIQADETWLDGHTYFIFSTFEVKGCTLTLEAGARVCLAAGLGTPPVISVSGNGAIEGKVYVNGTAAKPVIFDRQTPDDFYSGFSFVNNTDARFDYATFKNGGVGGLGILHFGANHAHPAVLRNVRFENMLKIGLNTQNPDGLSPDSTVYFDSQDAMADQPIITTMVAAAKTLTPSTIKIASAVPRNNRAIRFIDGVVSKDLTLSGTIGADYVVGSGDLQVRRTDAADPIPTLTLEPGARMRFGNGELRVGWIGMGNEGHLMANGTAANPIVFTSNEEPPARAQWNGITFYAGGASNMTLRNVRIENAGGGGGANIINCRSTSNLAGALKLRPIITTQPYAGPTLDALEVLRSGGDGVAFNCVTAGCLTTDYTGKVTGSDNMGTLLRPLGCM